MAPPPPCARGLAALLCGRGPAPPPSRVRAPARPACPWLCLHTHPLPLRLSVVRVPIQDSSQHWPLLRLRDSQKHPPHCWHTPDRWPGCGRAVAGLRTGPGPWGPSHWPAVQLVGSGGQCTGPPAPAPLCACSWSAVLSAFREKRPNSPAYPEMCGRTNGVTSSRPPRKTQASRC